MVQVLDCMTCQCKCLERYADSADADCQVKLPVKLWCCHQASLQACFQLAGRHEQPANHTATDSLLLQNKPNLEAAQRKPSSPVYAGMQVLALPSGGHLVHKRVVGARATASHAHVGATAKPG